MTDPKGLVKVIDNMLHKGKHLHLLPHEFASELADEFSEHFVAKLEMIWRH